MAEPTYIFNTSTGSDVAASGAGPATAITGSGASLNATTSVDLSADSPDLSGVATDGSAALWVQTSSGRQFSKITAVDNGTKVVTVATAYGVTEGSRTWAIGGKRATWDDTDSRTLFKNGDGAETDSIIETETDQTLTSAIADTAPNITIRGASETLRTITQTVNEPIFDTSAVTTDMDNTTVEWLKAQNSFGGSKDANCTFITFRSSGITTSPVVVNNCEIGDATNTLYYGLYRQTAGSYWTLTDTEIHHCISHGYLNGASSQILLMTRCYFHDNGQSGVNTTAAGSPMSAVGIDCVFANNGSCGFQHLRDDSTMLFANCAFVGNGNDGLEVDNGARLVMVQCVLSGNGAYGLDDDSTGINYDQSKLLGNVFYDNTSGNISVGTIPSGNYEASSDPFTDAASLDFSLADNAEADTIRAETDTAFDDSTTIYPFRWLDGASGGGGLQRPTDLNGGFIQ